MLLTYRVEKECSITNNTNKIEELMTLNFHSLKLLEGDGPLTGQIEGEETTLHHYCGTQTHTPLKPGDAHPQIWKGSKCRSSCHTHFSHTTSKIITSTISMQIYGNISVTASIKETLMYCTTCIKDKEDIF